MSESSDTSTNAAAIEASDSTQAKSTTAPAKSPAQRSLHGRLWELATYALLYALVVGGILYMASNAEAAVPYWGVVVAVVAVIAILAGWSRSKKGGGGGLGYLIKSLLHWGALIGVLYLLLLHQGHLQLDFKSIDLVLIYLLGLGCFFAGLHMDSRMLILGLYTVAAGLLSQGLIDTSTIDTKLVEGYISHDNAVLIGAAVAAFVLTALLDLLRPTR